ncbi:metal-iron-binding protein [Clostridium pasteurianum]|nr:ferritin family protein [Clostridium pasteurianum]AOZ77309.1 metal-iron-binding protein [Clostridium pasteurianum DSM 525 = ATCC 6013]AOZ81106.1 metal-iron-binding protein [Clostridium pasteurianum]OMH22896.1 metal-iron-binding protein [Clostridium pasteurianum]UZW16284.1 ferritin-like domain-containing protein [Clostridium pasteurianum]
MEQIKCMVCGMNINEKNFYINNSAFLEKNTGDKIIYCPFCGVSEIYLSNDGQTYTVDSSLLDENTLKIIDHAVKLEIFNGDFYKKASEMARSNEVKEIFSALSKIEMFHAKIHFRIGGFNNFPKLTEIDYDKYKYDTDKALLEAAEIREKHAVSYYDKYKHEVKDKTVVNIFNALSEVEKEHILLTSK